MMILIWNLKALWNDLADLVLYGFRVCDLCSVPLAEFCIYSQPYRLYKKLFNTVVMSAGP